MYSENNKRDEMKWEMIETNNNNNITNKRSIQKSLCRKSNIKCNFPNPI